MNVGDHKELKQKIVNLVYNDTAIILLIYCNGPVKVQ